MRAYCVYAKPFSPIKKKPMKRRQPSIEILFKIAEILNIEAKELIVSTKK